jgi:hypothetical protein
MNVDEAVLPWTARRVGGLAAERAESGAARRKGSGACWQPKIGRCMRSNSRGVWHSASGREWLNAPFAARGRKGK